MFKIVCRVALAMAMAGCAIQSGAQPAAQATPSVAESLALDTYQLGVGDRLIISVYGDDKVGGTQTVGPDGTIMLALIGRIPVEGRSSNQLAEDIRARLADGFIRSPSVTVQIETFRPYYILGEVNKPGEYPFVKGMTLMSAIAKAEGFTYRARKNWVFVTHKGHKAEERITISPEAMILPGDTVRVGERYY